jgi:hypothetical protein
VALQTLGHLGALLVFGGGGLILKASLHKGNSYLGHLGRLFRATELRKRRIGDHNPRDLIGWVG